MEPAARTLSYTDLPPGSRIICEQREGVLHITLPPTGFWAEAKWILLIVGAQVLLQLMLLGYIWYSFPVPMGVVWTMVRQHAWPDGFYMLLAILSICVLFPWIIGSVMIEIELSADTLLLRRCLWRFRWQQAWPREAVANVRCRFAVVLIRAHKWSRSATIRTSRAECQWLVRTLRQAMGMPAC